MTSTVAIEKVDRPELAKHDSSILDLVFVMDCTGSMGSYIDSARENIRSIVEEIVVSEKSDVRLALIEYRDHPPQDATFVTREHDFTAKVSEMKCWLNNCSAGGGGDQAEAVADGLHAVLKLSWRDESTKICILIADAPPHGLGGLCDGFPDGCPNGFDPVKIVREMAAKQITLYTVGVEPPIVPYRDFFMSLAYITGGQYVPMINAKLLAQVIIGGVREEITLERLMQAAQEDINREMRQAEVEGVDENEKIKRINNIFSSQNIRSQQMANPFGAFSTVSTTCYSKCTDMNEMKHQFATFSSGNTGFFGFGAPVPMSSTTFTTPFGASTNAPPASGFTFVTLATPTTTSLFGAPTTATTTSSSSFGTTPSSGTTSLFGTSTNVAPASGFTFGTSATPATTSLFGAPTTATTTSSSIFGTTPSSGTTSLFGTSTNVAPGSGFTFGVPSATSTFGVSTSTASASDPAYTNQTYELTEKDFSEAQASRIYQKWQSRHT